MLTSAAKHFTVAVLFIFLNYSSLHIQNSSGSKKANECPYL